MLKNQDIRNEIKETGLKFWQIAEEGLHITPGNFSCKLRRELTPEQKAEIRAIIAELREVN